MRLHSYESIIGYGVGDVSVSGFNWVCLDFSGISDNELRQTIPDRLVVSEENLNQNLLKRNLEKISSATVPYYPYTDMPVHGESFGASPSFDTESQDEVQDKSVQDEPIWASIASFENDPKNSQVEKVLVVIPHSKNLINLY